MIFTITVNKQMNDQTLGGLKLGSRPDKKHTEMMGVILVTVEILISTVYYTHTHKQAQTARPALIDSDIYFHINTPRSAQHSSSQLTIIMLHRRGPKIKLACYLALSLAQNPSAVPFSLPTICGPHSDLPSFPSPPAGY